MAFSDTLSILLGLDQPQQLYETQMSEASQHNMALMQDSLNPFSLGTNETKRNTKRTRREIYTKWEEMLRFAPIAEAMGIHIAAALGGDATTSQQVFIVPSQELRNSKDPTAKKTLKQLEERITVLDKLFNKNIVKICRDAIGFGDAYVRPYGVKGEGLVDLIANEFTYPPLIQAYEKLNKTVAYQALDHKSWQRKVAKLNMIQMQRLKMPRITHVPQFDPTDSLYVTRTLQADSLEDAPIIPAQIGGSFCAEVEKFYDNIILSLSAMNSQQIADAVNQVFLSVDMTAMPPAQRQAYKDGLEGVIKSHSNYVKDAFNDGNSIWNTKFHFLPTTNSKQILNPIGDIKGQRQSPINTETFMINVRLLMGGLGLDPSMVGWADMLAGGLGDGAQFHTSAQIMRRSMMLRTVTADFLKGLIALDWAYAYGEEIQPKDYFWDIEFYSDQSAATTESLTNQQTRMNTLILKSQALGALKETGLDEATIARLLERDGGMDYDEAVQVAKALSKKEDDQNLGVGSGENEPPVDDEVDDEQLEGQADDEDEEI